MTTFHSSLQIPDVIEADGDTFTVLELLGKGGMGIVYKARSAGLERVVALKLLHGHLYADAAAMQRLRREALAAGSFSHPNIVQVYRLATQGDAPFIVMEYVDGRTLSDLIDNEGKMPPGKVVDWFSQILDALSCIHEKGFVHRDIKPSNIIITADGGAKLSDFGIAKPYIDGEAQRMTQTGMMVGSPSYMSPEQCAGTAVDPRSDLYSLACSMYHALSGTEPFTADSPLELMFKHMNDQASTLQGVPPALADLVAKGMEKRPEERFQSASEFKDAMLNAAAQPEYTSTPRRTRKRSAQTSPPHIVAPLAAVVVCVVGLMCLMVASTPRAFFGTEQSIVPVTTNEPDTPSAVKDKERRVHHVEQLRKAVPSERESMAQSWVQELDKEIVYSKEHKRAETAADLYVEKAQITEQYNPQAATAIFQEGMRFIDTECARVSLQSKLRDKQAEMRVGWLEFASKRLPYDAFQKQLAEALAVIATRRQDSEIAFHRTAEDLYRIAAREALETGHPTEAERLARQAIAEARSAGRDNRTDYFASTCQLLQVLQAVGRYKEMFAIASVELDRAENVAMSDRTEEYTWRARSDIAGLCSQAAAASGDRKRCEQLFKIAIDSSSNIQDDDFRIPQLYMIQARNYAHFMDGKSSFRMAQEAYRACDKDPLGRHLDPEDCLFYVSAALKVGQPEAAYEAGTKLVKTLDASPKCVKFAAELMQADVCGTLKKYDEAATALAIAHELRASVQDRPESQLELERQDARLCLARADIEGARQHFRNGQILLAKAKVRNPGTANVFSNEYKIFQASHGV